MTAPARKSTPNDLALFGGPALFSSVKTTGQLANFDTAGFFDRALSALASRRLSNQGPLVRELEERLAEFHGAAHCICVANACIGIVIALYLLAEGEAGEVILPAMSFRGLPHVVRWAGLEPRYCDIEPEGHTLDPSGLPAIIGPNTKAILAVDNANGLCDINALERLSAAHGIPLLLDSVYAVGGRYSAGPVGSRGTATVFSLHATKLINGFEGGYITTNDEALAADLRKCRWFGFDDGRIPQLLGLNAKLNELHAALALSNLPHLDAIIDSNRLRFEAYIDNFAGICGLSFADYTQSPGNWSLVLMRVGVDWPFTREQTIRILRAENAFVRPYYSPPLHLADPDPAHRQAKLVHAEAQSQQFIQMPVGEFVAANDVVALADLMRFAHLHAEEILPRLKALC